MRRSFIFLNLIGLLLTINQIYANPKTDLNVPVEVVEVKDLGLSDRDESKSVIEVRWSADSIQKEKIASFVLVLSVTYANGTTVSEKRTAEREARVLQVEVSSVKTFGGRTSAFIKKIDARVVAVLSKN
jgi:hypothetical protein